MANLYQTAPYKGRPEKEQYLALMAKAEAEHDWECLKPYPMLLCIWQGKHPADLLPIARWVSHFRMPFQKPDLKTHTVVISSGSDGKNQRLIEGSVTTGKEQYGHALCKPDCGTHDYITGDLLAPPLPI